MDQDTQLTSDVKLTASTRYPVTGPMNRIGFACSLDDHCAQGYHPPISRHKTVQSFTKAAHKVA